MPSSTGWGHEPACIAAERLPTDHGQDLLPSAGPSGPAAELSLAGLRPGAGLPGAAPFPRFLAAQPRWPAPFGRGGVAEADSPGRVPPRQGAVHAALSATCGNFAAAGRLR